MPRRSLLLAPLLLVIVPCVSPPANAQSPTAPGSALMLGMELVYASGGRESPPWRVDSLDLAVRVGGRSRCSVVRFGPSDLRRTCLEGDTLYTARDSGTPVPTRPVGPGMTMRVAGTRGRTLVYQTMGIDTHRITGFVIPVVATVVTTLDSTGRPVTRLRERFAPSLGTAVDGTFEVPAEGGWAVQREFALVRIVRPGVPSGTGGGGLSPADSARLYPRLAALARVWGAVRYYHPRIGAGAAIDWDSALVAALPAVRAARTGDEYQAAVQRLLDVLDDPLTRVARVGDTPAAGAVAARPFGYHLTADSILVVIVGSYFELGGTQARETLDRMLADLSRAQAIVFDSRTTAPGGAYGRYMLEATFAELTRRLIGDTVVTPADRRRIYYGLESGTFGSGLYRTGYTVDDGSVIAPARGARDVPWVFVTNDHASLLPAAIPLQVRGRARIVHHGELRRHGIGSGDTIPLTDGLAVLVRTAAPLLTDGRSAVFQPDSVVRGPEAEATAVALAMARAFRPSVRERAVLPSVVAPVRNRAYPGPFPERDARILAAFRLWYAVDQFYPYHHLLSRPWSPVLAELLPQFDRARTGEEYARAVAAMAARIEDSHAYVAGGAFEQSVIPSGYPPIRVRSIQGRLIVTAIFDSATAAGAGVRVGDEVTQVDGAPAAERLARTGELLSTSTPQSRLDRATLQFMNGPVGSTVSLTLRTAGGAVRQAALARRREDYTTLYHRERTGPILRVLPGNVGYADLDRLPFEMIDSMFTLFRGTRAIIFDMRGYPNGTTFAIVPRLTAETRVVARFRTPMRGHRSPHPAAESYAQTVDPAGGDAPPYRGRLVMLMDERTVSLAEHTGLYLKAVDSALFVGSPTAGANGQITTVSLPGGLTVGFTGQEVTWPDGRQLQRIGLVPDVRAAPTVAGIRAGRDEVLEAALRALRAPAR
jgi:C-terminal processing protease CtpA/Prc